MANCWRSPTSALDKDAVWSPERYSPEREQHRRMSENAIPLLEIARHRKDTFTPGNADPDSMYAVLDTTHAYEGRVQFRGEPVRASAIGSIKRPLKEGLVIISRLRTYLRQVALIDNDAAPGFNGQILSSTEFYVLESSNGEDIAFLVPFLLSEPVQKIFSAAEEGGHHPRIPPDVLMRLLVPRALVEKREELSKRVRESIKLMRAGEQIMAQLHADVREVMSADPALDDAA